MAGCSATQADDRLHFYTWVHDHRFSGKAVWHIEKSVLKLLPKIIHITPAYIFMAKASLRGTSDLKVCTVGQSYQMLGRQRARDVQWGPHSYHSDLKCEFLVVAIKWTQENIISSFLALVLYFYFLNEEYFISYSWFTKHHYNAHLFKNFLRIHYMPDTMVWFL